MAENERENKHHDLKEDANSGSLLILNRTAFGLCRRDDHNLGFVLHAHDGSSSAAQVCGCFGI